jgi:hypothetical protein
MADAEDETWEDWEEGEDECVSLFAQAVCPSGQAALALDKADYGFDLAALKAKLGLDLYGMIKVHCCRNMLTCKTCTLYCNYTIATSCCYISLDEHEYFALVSWLHAQVVNFVRSRVAAAGGGSQELAAALVAEIESADNTAVLQGDKYLQPFLEDDALLFSLDQVHTALPNINNAIVQY